MRTSVYLIASLRKLLNSLLSKSQRPYIGGVLFILGSILGFGFMGFAVLADLNGASFWGDYRDAMAFDREKPTQAELVKINCPILLAPGEEGTITARFQNPNQRKADVMVKVIVSKRAAENYRDMTGNLIIESGQEQNFDWQINQQDIIERNFILTRVFLMNQDASIPYPARTDSCGIFIWSLFGLKGASTVVLMVGTCLISLVAGSVLIYISDSSLKNSSPRLDYGLYCLAGILLIGMIANLLGWWILAGLILLLAVLLTSIIIQNMLVLLLNR